MNTTFALVLTVYLVFSGESLELVTGLYGSMKECMAAAAEQKIPVTVIR